MSPSFGVRFGSWSCKSAATWVVDKAGGEQWAADILAAHTLIAAISGLMPTMFITRVRL